MADEYIRKQDVVDKINANADDLEQNGGIPYAQGARAMAIVVEQMPPANVIEIKHGEWISTPEMWGAFDVRYYCSKCGKDAIINNRERYVLSDYCPHCGAIMDNKRGNEND